jgi:hypothetical protein
MKDDLLQVKLEYGLFFESERLTSTAKNLWSHPEVFLKVLQISLR